MVLLDRWGRPVIGVRISVNHASHCNFSCVFCHREGIPESTEVMTPGEIERIVAVMKRFGVDKVKITGGEPMLRKDIVEIVSRMKKHDIREISMTTNGTLLDQRARELRRAGLDRVNISLHSLRKERYSHITGAQKLEETLATISSAAEAGLTPVKLNVVVMKEVNEDEIDEMIAFTGKVGGGEKVVLQLIELVEEGEAESQFFKDYFYDLAEVERKLEERAILVTTRKMHNRRRYHLQNGVVVEVVPPMDNCEFCMGNDRMRITHDGDFKPCLLRTDNQVNFLKAMRNGCTDEELEELFKKAVLLREPFFKPEGPLFVKET